MPDLVPTTTLFTIAGVDFHLVDLLVIAIALVLMFCLQALVFGITLGLTAGRVTRTNSDFARLYRVRLQPPGK